MRTLGEISSLLLGTLRRWTSHFFVLGTWVLLGMLCLTAASYGSVMIGGRNRFLATLVFVTGAVAQLLTTIMAIHSLRSTVRLPERPAPTESEAAVDSPTAQLRASERITEVLVGSMGAFIGVYAVWGLVDGWLNRLVRLNLELRRPGDWSVAFTLDQVWFYTALAVGAYLLKVLIGRLAAHLTSPWWRSPTLLLEGMWEFASFFMFLSLLGIALEWLTGRAVWTGAVRLWHSFIDVLPTWRMLGASLPEVVSNVAGWLVQVFVPTVWNDILFPLAWLTLVATVFGWREGLEEVRTRNPLERAIHFAATDLRGKWLPVLRSLRLVLSAGPRALGSLILCAAALGAARRLLTSGLVLAVGPVEQAEALATRPMIELAVTLVCDTLQVALYVAALGRILDRGPESARLGLPARRGAHATQRGVPTTIVPPRLNPVVENSVVMPSTRVSGTE